jgi:hypothetical protein
MLNRQEMEAIKIGDRIKFRAACMWNGGETVVRMVNGKLPAGDKVTVRYGGYGDFEVRACESKEVIKKGEN